MTRFARGSDGSRIAYEVVGDGPPILLIHGFAASRAITWRNTNWYAWLQRSGRRVVAMDCRGHGDSEKPRDPASYDDRIMAGDILAVLDDAEIPRSDCMGYSMGGYLTMNLLTTAPERFGRAILGGVGENYFSFWPDRTETIAQGLAAETDEAVTDPVAKEFRTFATRAGNDLAALAACARRRRLSLSRDEMSSIPHPVLVVCGELDHTGGPPGPLAELFPHGRAVTVSRRNHHSTVGDPAYKQAVREFLEEGAVRGTSASAS
jgi:pimeloyl-ACP methyl ester carboxylesterase